MAKFPETITVNGEVIPVVEMPGGFALANDGTGRMFCRQAYPLSGNMSDVHVIDDYNDDTE